MFLILAGGHEGGGVFPDLPGSKMYFPLSSWHVHLWIFMIFLSPPLTCAGCPKVAYNKIKDTILQYYLLLLPL